MSTDPRLTFSDSGRNTWRKDRSSIRDVPIVAAEWSSATGGHIDVRSKRSLQLFPCHRLDPLFHCCHFRDAGHVRNGEISSGRTTEATAASDPIRTGSNVTTQSAYGSAAATGRRSSAQPLVTSYMSLLPISRENKALGTWSHH